MSCESRNKKVTIGEIARQLKLSPSTVSRALKNHSGISDATRERAQKRAQELGYRPNGHVARYFKSIRQEVSGAALLLDSSVSHRLQVQDSFYLRIPQALQAALRAQGMHMLLANTESDLLDDGNLYAVSEGMADGVIGLGADPQIIQRLTDHCPVVQLNQEDRVPEVDVVIPDVEGAVRCQLDYLARAGHRRVACFRPTTKESWQDKRYWREYRDYGMQIGLYQPEAYFAPIEFDRDQHVRAISDFLNRVLQPAIRPTAIVTYDLYAGALIHQLGERGLDVPGNISVIGFDDSTHAHYCPTPLTTYRQDFEAMARMAIYLLRSRTKTPGQHARLVEIQGQLIERMSSAPVERRCNKFP